MKKHFSALRLMAAFIITAAAASPLFAAEKLMVASGAGYKKPVSEIMKAFEKSTGVKTEGVFGNLQMISEQVKQTGQVSVVIADKKFLDDTKTGISYAEELKLGEGLLVLAYRRGSDIKKVEDLAGSGIKSIFMAEKGKAIYGTAAAETFEAYGYTERLADKTTRVATVPQVVQYLLTGEADAGFINLTEALANREKLGGYIIVPAGKYKPIILTAAVVKGSEKKAETVKFLNFIKTKRAGEIFGKHG